MSKKMGGSAGLRGQKRNLSETPGIDDGASLSAIDDLVERCLIIWKVPGVAVGLVVRGCVVLAKGYGSCDASRKERIESDTPFLIASCTKSFTATAMATLVEDGVLDWDEPVKTYLTRFRMRDELATARTSVRDLLTHRWGLAPHDYLWVTSTRTRGELVRAMSHLAPKADFRSRFQYSNLAYLAAAYVLEQLTGMSWEDFVAERILRPLGIEPRFATHIRRRQRFGGASTSLPEGYKMEGGLLKEWFRPWGKSVGFADVLGPSGPSGSLALSITEMCRWLQFQMAERVDWAPGGLDPSMLRELHRPQVVLPAGWMALGPEFLDAAYGMGWWIQPYRGRRVLAHAGNCCGFHAMMSFMPDEKTGIAVLTNCMTSPLPLAVTYELYDRLLGLRTESGWVLRLTRSAKPDRVAIRQRVSCASNGTHRHKWQRRLADFTGVYRHPGYGLLRISAQGNRLVMKYGGFLVKLARCGENDFNDSGWLACLEGEGAAATSNLVFHETRDGRIAEVLVQFDAQSGAIRFRACGLGSPK